ncbi:MAG: hypothetical protein HY926_05270 [Elusimicrobia bacterium]|nr:hypothetical protein [Elusimicrobiota bacterium]
MDDPLPGQIPQNPAAPAASGPVFPPGYPRPLKPEELRRLEPAIRPPITIGLIALALLIAYALLPARFPVGLYTDPFKTIGVMIVFFLIALPIAWWVKREPPSSPGLSKLAGTLLFPAYITQCRPLPEAKLELSVLYQEDAQVREATAVVLAPKGVPDLETKMLPLLRLPDGTWYPLIEHVGKADIA